MKQNLAVSSMCCDFAAYLVMERISNGKITKNKVSNEKRKYINRLVEFDEKR